MEREINNVSDGEERKRPFTSGSVIDDLTEWARKLKVLGNVLESLARHENNGHGADNTLESCGEVLGDIIMDYAELIEETVMEHRESFVNHDENVVFPLARCQEVYDFIGKARRIEDLAAIDFRVKELGAFIEDAAVPAMRLKTAFETLRKEILAEEKRISVAESAAATA